MTLDDYQKKAATFDMLGDGTGTDSVLDAAYIAKVLGLVGEAGEVAEKFKKIIRDKDSIMSASDTKEISKELGDVLWYLAVIAQYMDVPLHEIAEQNLEKLSSRKARGTHHGEGDNR